MAASKPIAGRAGDRPLESTVDLLAAIRQGDLRARETLLGRYLPPLKRWAHGRLPARARDLAETDDLVQNTMVRALSHLDGFDVRHPGAFLAYLRQILLNQVRDEIRRVGRRPVRQELGDDLVEKAPSPVEDAIGEETLEAYQAGLAKLGPRQQEALVLKIEMGFTNEEIAQAVGCKTANAARVLVARALVRLAEEMDPGT
jgi:RNA polymerase sigma-70 factor (ECF subfamily)